MCTVLDHQALGRSDHAADIAIQGVRALELAYQTVSWERASVLELIFPDDATLVRREEQWKVAKETELHQQIQRNGPKPQWPAFQPFGGNWQGCRRVLNGFPKVARATAKAKAIRRARTAAKAKASRTSSGKSKCDGNKGIATPRAVLATPDPNLLQH